MGSFTNFLNTIRSSVFLFKNNLLETGLCLRTQVKSVLSWDRPI